MRGLARGAEAAALVLLSPSCATCGAVLQHLRAGSTCERCWSAIQPFTPPFCDRCGDPLPSLRRRLDGLTGAVSERAASGDQIGNWRDKIVRRVPDAQAPRPGQNQPVERRAPHDAPHVCAHCAAGRGEVDRARAIGSYDGALRDIIHSLKYGKRQSIAPRLGRLMREHGTDVLAGADIALPVPLHWSRRYWRGFNQAELLAGQLGLPVGHLLRRVRRTRPQVDLPARARQANVEGAFALRRRETWRGPAWLRRLVATPLEGLTVVLVDDVSTTGATLEACARVVKRAGAKEVRVITAARVATRRHW